MIRGGRWLHHATAKAERAQHADLLSPLDNRAGADHSERCDADDEAEAHEALYQPVEQSACRDCVLDRLLDRLGLNTACQKRGLELLAADSGSTPGARSK